MPKGAPFSSAHMFMDRNIVSSLRLPAVKLGIAYAAGCLTACFGNDFLRIMLICAAAVMTAAGFIRRRGRMWAAGLLAGLLSISGYIWIYCQPLKQLSGSEVRTTCRITSVISSSSVYTYAKAQCSLDGIPATITLSGSCKAQPGDCLDVLISLQQADDGLFTFSDGIVLSGRIEEIYSQEHRFSLMYYVDRIRAAAASRLDALGGDEGELCKGLLLGETGGFSLGLRRDITYSGVNYMTAVSGAHITLVLMILMELFGRERRRLHAVIALIAVPALAVLFGFSPSVMRAGLMMLFSKCGILFCRKADTLNSICAAFLALTLFTPYAAADPALLMSVLGVFGAAVLGPAVNGLRKFRFERFGFAAKVKQAAVISFCAMICIAPVSISCFGGISLAEVPASVALAPFFAAAVGLGLLYLLTGFPMFAVPLLWVMKCFRGIIAFFGDIGGVWLAADNAAAVPLAFLAAALLIAGAFLPDHTKAALEAFVLTLALFLCISMYSVNSRHRIDFVSDGKSGAAVVCTRNEAAVVISGTGADLAYPLYNAFTRNGITHIRLINAPQLDHAGAYSIGELTELFPADEILCPEALGQYTGQKCPGADTGEAVGMLTLDGTVIACAKSGDGTVSGDIVMYYSYTRSVPYTAAALPVYVSSRQNELPENGINIYDERLRIEIKE